jgi:uncharacterized protein YjcR
VASATFIIKSYTKSEILNFYGLSYPTLRDWMERAGIKTERRILSPAEVEKFVKHHGSPEKPLSEDN